MDVMTPHVITIDPDASMQALARLLSERNRIGPSDRSNASIGCWAEDCLSML